MLIKRMLHAALLLTFFAVLSGVLVAVSFQMTYQQIQYDNDLFTDIREVQNEALLGTDEPVMIYRARQAGQPIAAVLTPVAPDGYNGHIRLCAYCLIKKRQAWAIT